MLLADLVEVSEAVSASAARSQKIKLLAGLIGSARAEEAEVAISYLSGSPRQKRLGVGYATVFAIEAEPASVPSLELLDVDKILEEVAGTSGAGSKARKSELLTGLLRRASPSEHVFLRGLILRNLRQGALEGVMADAIALALDVGPERVRRAAMLEGDLISVGARAISLGPDTLGASILEVFTPVQPMLAKTAESARAAVVAIGRALVEQKLDGLRIQVHRRGNEVLIFTRNLREVTAEMPGVVSRALAYEAESFILDGEALMLREDGSPHAFQDSMSRPASSRELTPFFFDILSRDGLVLVDEPLSVRHEALHDLVPEGERARSVVTSDGEEAERFFTEVVDSGFEGVVVKDVTQAYEAGRRGSGWLKVKPMHTLDLVILAAEWGSGRRQGWLSNLHLGARGPDGAFVMLGKTFKGLTDEMLAWQTTAFLEIEDRRDGRVVYLRPEIVYEIAFDGVQRSTRYPGGVALRFARVKRYRSDKAPADADRLETVQSFLR